MLEVNPTISITVNVNNSFKRQVFFQTLCMCITLLYAIKKACSRFEDTNRWKVKDWKNIFHANSIFLVSQSHSGFTNFR